MPNHYELIHFHINNPNREPQGAEEETVAQLLLSSKNYIQLDNNFATAEQYQDYLARELTSGKFVV